MELFKKEYIFQLERNKFIIIPKSFLKVLIIDNKSKITKEVLAEYIALSEIEVVEEFKVIESNVTKFQLTQLGYDVIKNNHKVSQSAINNIIEENRLIVCKKNHSNFENKKQAQIERNQ